MAVGALDESDTSLTEAHIGQLVPVFYASTRVSKEDLIARDFHHKSKKKAHPEIQPRAKALRSIFDFCEQKLDPWFAGAVRTGECNWRQQRWSCQLSDFRLFAT